MWLLSEELMSTGAAEEEHELMKLSTRRGNGPRDDLSGWHRPAEFLVALTRLDIA